MPLLLKECIYNEEYSIYVEHFPQTIASDLQVEIPEFLILCIGPSICQSILDNMIAEKDYHYTMRDTPLPMPKGQQFQFAKTFQLSVIVMLTGKVALSAKSD